jgi:hypothetical protein
MIIQTAPSDTPRLAIMMYEHTALCLQFAHAFGNERFDTTRAGSISTAIQRSIKKPGFPTILQRHPRSTLQRPAGFHLISTNATIPTAV